MKNIKKKGFTLVELVIVIAVIAILAGVLIGTFASVIKRANDSAEVQNIKNAEIAQKADDIIKKIEDSNWFGWEEYEADIVTKITKIFQEHKGDSSYDGLTSDEVTTIVHDALASFKANTGYTDITADQIKAIVENAIGTLQYEGVTEAQVRAIVNAATATTLGNSLSAAQVRAIINSANENNLTAAQLAQAVAGLSTTVTVENAVETIKGALTTSVQGLATSTDIDALRETIEAYSISNDNDTVVIAKSLNVLGKRKGITSVSTPTEWIEATGANVEQLTYDTGSNVTNIIFDLTTGKFSVIDSDNKILFSETLFGTISEENRVNYWVFVNDYNNNLEYSQYLLSSTSQVINIDTGLDVGKNEGISEINYTSTIGHAVVIRTNGGTLTVNAPADTVMHYGNADSVNIVAVASASYHENGTVPFIQISKGRIEIEATADVNGIHVANVQTVDTNGNITKTENTFSNDVVLTLNGNDVKLTRDTIGTEIATPVLVCEVQANANSDEYIWLVGDGTIENAKVYVTETKTTPDTSVASTTTTENASAAAIAIANNATNTGTEEAPIWTAEEAGKTADEAENAAALWGTGRSWDPYIVSNLKQWSIILKLDPTKGSYVSNGTTYYYYDVYKLYNDDIDDYIYIELASDLDFSDFEFYSEETNWYGIHLDGKGHKVSNISNAALLGKYAYLNDGVYITNISFENCDARNVIAEAVYPGGNGLVENCTFTNCTANYGALMFAGNYINYNKDSTNQWKLEIKNCSAFNCNVNDSKGGWGFVGGFVGNSGNAPTYIDSCYFDGEISTSSQTGAGGFIGSTYWGNMETWLVSSVKNSTISANTTITNKQQGGKTYALANAYWYKTTGNTAFNAQLFVNNSFQGKLSSTNNGNASGVPYNDLYGTNISEADVWIKYNSSVTKDKFELDYEHGVLTYTGDQTFAKLKVVQSISIDSVVDRNLSLGGYPRYIETIEKANVTTNDTVNYSAIKTIKQVVNSEDNLPVSNSTTDETVLVNPDSYGFSLTGNSLYYDARLENGNGSVLSNTWNKTKPLGMTLIVTAYDQNENVIGAATFYYEIDSTK